MTRNVKPFLKHAFQFPEQLPYWLEKSPLAIYYHDVSAVVDRVDAIIEKVGFSREDMGVFFFGVLSGGQGRDLIDRD